MNGCVRVARATRTQNADFAFCVRVVRATRIKRETREGVDRPSWLREDEPLPKFMVPKKKRKSTPHVPQHRGGAKRLKKHSGRSGHIKAPNVFLGGFLRNALEQITNRTNTDQTA